MSTKIAYTMRIDEEIYEKAKIVAESELRSVNNLIEFLLLQKIREYEATQNALGPTESTSKE